MAKSKKKTVKRSATQSARKPAKKSAKKAAKRTAAARQPAGATGQASPADRRRAKRIYDQLLKQYPDAACALEHRDAFELLVATILSAQCTDVRVNMVTPALFKKYPDARALAKAKADALEAMIRSTGFYRNKTKSLLGASQRIVAEHGGKVPGTMDELTALPGVARKTANVVLGNAFSRNVGVVVDTHVARLSKRLGLSTHTDPTKIERDLMALFSQDTWTMLAHLLIFHGRRVCAARKPKCDQCALAGDCPKVGVPAMTDKTG